MAEYLTPTVVQPAIPIAEPVPARPAELQALLEASAGMESRAAKIVRERLAASEPSAKEIDIDLSLDGFEGVFQDIVRRSPVLDHVQIMISWTCTRMRPDGFGGAATFITADGIETMSTADFLEAALARLDGHALPDA